MIADESAEPTMVEESPAMAVMPIVRVDSGGSF